MIKCIVTANMAETNITRQDMEDIEDVTFETVDGVDKHFAPKKVTVYTLSEWVDALNNEEIDIDKIWVTHINIK
jgi:hypothetical protein